MFTNSDGVVCDDCNGCIFASTALKQLYNIYFQSAECLISPPPTISEKRGRIKENTVNSDGVIIEVYD